MKSRDFCYWLQGYFELLVYEDPKMPELNSSQVLKIRKHLEMVFTHEIDPSFGDKKEQQKLNVIHHKDSDTLLRC